MAGPASAGIVDTLIQASRPHELGFVFTRTQFIRDFNPGPPKTTMDAAPRSYTYPFQDFLRDLDALEAQGAFSEGPFERVMGFMTAHFHAQYPDRSEATNKSLRFYSAMDYLTEHLETFDIGDLSVFGSRSVGALVGEHLLEAIHQLIVAPPNRSVRNLPSTEDVIRLATEIRRLSESAPPNES